jgi:hypothetical protein
VDFMSLDPNLIPTAFDSGSSTSSRPGLSRPFTCLFRLRDAKAWMPGTRPGMTTLIVWGQGRG